MAILTIIGPTAVGKTDVAMLIAEKISGEIVSADSRQIYKHLNIGTAKPSKAQRRKIPFHLIDFIELEEEYSCGQFARDAEEKIDKILTRKKIPIVCGGTGLYIRALFHPLDNLPRSSARTKEKLRKMLQRHGIEYMYRKLQRIDPLWAGRIKSRDKQRILRGMEVFELTGKPISAMMGKKKTRAKFPPHYVGLRLQRDALYSRINTRFEQMLSNGLVKETEALLKEGFDPGLSALRTIGYKEITAYLQGTMSFDEAVERAKRRTRNYAKRQMTWFSKLPSVVWYDATDPELVNKIISSLKQETMN
ncbi:MAG: tRNA (adenosine(37)-N6)-dimethylallyltransferase MiaA [candidate division WOR-3 bacterium]|nr:MAG: tRNA (adenosine(37)-N6)-dimethylallyltransferase MiaA [candidate division WOR-3 bacterium]